MSKLNQLWTFLEGKKTHIVATVLGALNVLVVLNVIDPAHLAQINLVLVALGLSALRSGITKID